MSWIVGRIAGRSNRAEVGGVSEVGRTADRDHAIAAESGRIEVRMVKDIEKLASYFASFFTVPNPEEAPKVASEDEKSFQRGKQLATTQCISCHQNSLNRGLPNDDLLPILAGQSKQYLMVQLFRFKKSEARNNMMHIYAEPLTDKDIEALATFFTFSP